MNIGGGEAADQMVRMMLSSGEVTVRLTGSALKNLAALTLALTRNHKKVSGKRRLGAMLRETRDLRVFSMTPEQYRAFKKQAGKKKLLYAVIRDRDGRGKRVDVVLPVTEVERANPVFERIRYAPSQRQERETVPRSRKQPERPPAREVPPKKEFRSGSDLADTSNSFNSSRGRDALTTTHERPSIAERLKGYREQLDRQHREAPARNKQVKKERTK